MGIYTGIEDFAFLDAVSSEIVEIAGTTIILYSIRKEATQIDIVYNEQIEDATYYAYKIQGVVRRPEQSSDAMDRGMHWEWDAEVGISRKHLEITGAPEPKEGDVIEFWNTQYDIIRVQREGWVNDENAWLWINCILKRRTKFVPEKLVKAKHV